MEYIPANANNKVKADYEIYFDELTQAIKNTHNLTDGETRDAIIKKMNGEFNVPNSYSLMFPDDESDKKLFYELRVSKMSGDPKKIAKVTNALPDFDFKDSFGSCNSPIHTECVIRQSIISIFIYCDESTNTFF